MAKDNNYAMCQYVIVSNPALKDSQSKGDVMKKQMEGLAREYDRLLKEHQELQVTISPKHSTIMTSWVIMLDRAFLGLPR